MYLTVLKEKSTGRTRLFVQRQQRVRDPETGVSRKVTLTVRDLGYLDELEREYDDPVAHFREELRRESEGRREALREERTRNDVVTVNIKRDGVMPFDKETGVFSRTLGTGDLAVRRVLGMLGVTGRIRELAGDGRTGYDLAELVAYLVARRVTDPSSKLQDWRRRGRCVGEPDISLADVYRGLDRLSGMREEVMLAMHRGMVSRFGRDAELMFYDVTNVHFETDWADGFREKGVAKSHKPLPIVQIGLFMDRDGVPVWVDTYPGDTNDCVTFLPSWRRMRGELGAGHAIYVADKAMHTGDNVGNIVAERCGYVISESVRKAREETRRTALDSSGYTAFGLDGRRLDSVPLLPDGRVDMDSVSFMYKAVETAGDITVTDTSSRKVTVRNFPRRKIFYWSRKYALRAREERCEAVEKAMAMSHARTRSVIDNSHGANRYLRTEVSTADGRKVEDYRASVRFDFARLDGDEILDGYYIIETNVAGREEYGDVRETFWDSSTMRLVLARDVDTEDIIGMYRGLWRIEDCFRVTKSQLSLRPVYLRREDRIASHVLICFMALTVIRLLDRLSGGRFTAQQIVESLREAKVAEVNSFCYLNLFHSPFLASLREPLGLDFGVNAFRKSDLTRMWKIATRDS